MERPERVDVAPSKRLAHALRNAGVVLLGLLAGGFGVQDLFQLLASITEAFTPLGVSLDFLLCTAVVVLGGLILWVKQNGWLGGSIAVGAIVWTAVVTWIVYEMAKGMSDFP